MAVERKYERDIDVLLAEEFCVNQKFASWFLRQTKFAERPAEVVDVFVSKADNLGESDLIVLFEDRAGKFALLIEDKVDAPLQPDQAQRYRLRAEKEVQREFCAAYEIVLCAPDHYIMARTDLDGFDRRVSFERVADFLDTQADKRSSYRAAFLRTAASRRVNTWVREEDEDTTVFWSAAYKLASERFAILEMKPPKPAKAQAWMQFRPRDLPTTPKWTYVSLKGDRGHVDLTFSNTQAAAFAGAISCLHEGMTVHQTAASAAIRITVEGFTPNDGLEAGMPKVERAFQAAGALIEFYRRNRRELDQAALAAPHI